ncbi:tail fiber domain-containing protein [Azospirillum tabaci]|uniref:tail fiber domain-containing protein n=1 Tax=Azospirillum tabaci TaxID=2752310 RepID=UPI001660A2FB|nr:tail fiber domain-containing protein [Azospirillum tabaci]
MSVVKISDLPVGVTLTGSEVLPVVQVGGTRKSTVGDLRAYMIGSIDPADIGAVPVERTVTVSGLLTGGGNLGADITISMASQTGPVVLGVASGTASPTALSAPMLAVITAANAAAARVFLGLGTIATADAAAYALAGHLHAVATTTAAGFLSAADKVKLDGISSGANAYVLPPASISTLGGVKVGAGLSGALDGTLSAAVLSVAGKSGAVTLTGSDVGLGAVENKSSATIRGELTSSNVTSALGFTPMSTSHPAAAITGFAGSGSATTVARSDHTHAYLPISGGTLTGSMTAPSLVLTSTDQIRMKASTTAAGYGVVHRHDGDSYYILLTNNGDANGIWNALRPFRLVLATGQVHIQTGLTLSTPLTSTVATGTAPFSVLSTTTVTNLSADLLDGLDSTAFALAGHTHAYLPLSGGTLTGAVSVQGATSLGSIGLIGGDATHPGFIEFRTGDGVRRGYVGWSNGSSRLQLASENGWRWDFTDIVSCGGTNVSLEGHTHTAFGALGLSGVLTSTVATGTAPFSVASTTTVTNLSADLLDGLDSTYFMSAGVLQGEGGYIAAGITFNYGWKHQSASGYGFALRHSGSGGAANTGGRLEFQFSSAASTGVGSTATMDRVFAFDRLGQLTVPAPTGTAPFVISSTTTVTNLSADLLDGHHAWEFPLSIVTADDITARVGSGFYQTGSATAAHGWPETSGNWYHLISSTHHNTANYYAMQFAGSFFDSTKLFYRATNGSGATAWLQVYTSGNLTGAWLGQDVRTTASPTFAGLTLTNAIAPTIRMIEADNSNHFWDLTVDSGAFSLRYDAGWPPPFLLTSSGLTINGLTSTNSLRVGLGADTRGDLTVRNGGAAYSGGDPGDARRGVAITSNTSGAATILSMRNLTDAAFLDLVQQNGSLSVNKFTGSGYTTLLSLSGGGNLSLLGSLAATSAVFTSADQIRLKSAATAANYGLILRQDGSTFYMLATANNDADGSWSALRPFYFSLADGVVVLGNGLVVSGLCRPGADAALALGSASYRWSTVYAATGTINTSDARQKTDLGADPLGLDFILALKPHAYRWKNGRRVHTGLFSQEVRAAVPANLDWAGWTLADPNDQTSLQGLRLDQLWAPTITSIQVLHSRQQDAAARIDLITEQQQDAAERIAALESEVADLRTRLAA